jgi:hypothetical protein
MEEGEVVYRDPVYKNILIIILDFILGDYIYILVDS